MDGDLLVAGGYNYRDQAVVATWGIGMVWAFKRDSNDMYQLLGNVTAPDALQCKSLFSQQSCLIVPQLLHTLSTETHVIWDVFVCVIRSF
jgi:hypothetical protein